MRSYVICRQLVAHLIRVAGRAAAILVLAVSTAGARGSHSSSLTSLDLTNILLGLWVLLFIFLFVAKLARSFRERKSRATRKDRGELERLLSDSGISLYGEQGEELKDEHQEL